MNAAVVLPIVFAVAVGWVIVVLQGTGDLDELVERWRTARRDRAAIARQRELQAALRSPRSIP